MGAVREPGADRRVQRVAVDALQYAPHGGPVRGGSSAVRLAHGAAETGEQAGRGVGRPIPRSPRGSGPGKDRAGSQSQDEDHQVALTPGPAWIGHEALTGQEPGMADRQGRGSVGELAQADSDGR
ncbi:hypothetical protein ASD08_45935 [Streptomyces sp. Root369]|nr:hypothetical protein ASD08_45935 [Streptomyces sp. Root369]